MILIIGLIIGFTSFKINDLQIAEICKEIPTEACFKITESNNEINKKDKARHERQLELEKKYYP